MCQAYCGVRLVDVLPALAARTIGVDSEVVLIDFDINVVLNLCDDVDGSEGRMATFIGVEWTDPHQSMHSALSPRVAVGVLANNSKRGSRNSCFVAGSDVVDFKLEAPEFRQTGV